MESLHPFALLGVTIDSTPEEARAAFRELALLAHPDKGGRPDEMRVLMRAYRYVAEQLGAVNRSTTVEDLEAGFADFCAAQRQDEELRPAWIRELLQLGGGGAEFEAAFEARWQAQQQAQQQQDDTWVDEEQQQRQQQEDPWNGVVAASAEGYGALMSPSEYVGLPVAPVEYRPVHPIVDEPAQSQTQARTQARTQAQSTYTEFQMAIAPYSEPQALASQAASRSTALHSVDYMAAFNTTPDAVPPVDDRRLATPVDALFEERLKLLQEETDRDNTQRLRGGIEDLLKGQLETPGVRPAVEVALRHFRTGSSSSSSGTGGSNRWEAR
jgi:hypothetical protein